MFVLSATLFTPANRKFLILLAKSTNSTSVSVINSKLSKYQLSRYLVSYLMFSKKGAFKRLFLRPWIGLMPQRFIFILALSLASPQIYAEPYGSVDDYVAIESSCNHSQSNNEFSEISTIRYIHDGDTLHLKSGRKVRLIGINTPELARNNKPAEPFALQAKQSLQSLFATDKTIALIYGKDKIDRYGRLLAHAFTQDGRNVQMALLEQGVASTIAIPPNTRFTHCYLEAEKKARCSKTGLWYNDATLAAKTLKQGDTGFKFIRGTVKHIEFNDKGIWLNLDDKLTVGIRPDEQYLFNDKTLKSLRNKSIVVRGWNNKSNRQTPFYMRIKHPLAIQLATEYSCD